MGEKESRLCDTYFLFFFTYYALRGGSSGSSSYSGLFSIIMTGTFSYIHWAHGAHYAICGCRSGSGAYCGAFCVSVNDASSAAYLSLGAALLFKVFILI